jgi:hypothetical protein
MTADRETAITLADFIAENHVTMTTRQTDHNPNSDWDRAASHWLCYLRCAGRRMRVTFSMGSALTGPPSLAEVLDCLASDAAGLENARSFEEWAGEYGYDPDSRKALRTFKVVERQASALARSLGDDSYQTLLWHVER